MTNTKNTVMNIFISTLHTLFSGICVIIFVILSTQLHAILTLIGYKVNIYVVMFIFAISYVICGFYIYKK